VRAGCHHEPLRTEPGWNQHTADEIKRFNLGLTDQEKHDLVEYLKWL
jgi:hypothetical protein